MRASVKDVPMASTLVTFSSLLKQRYGSEKVEDLTIRERPLLSMIPKDEEGAGLEEKVPLIYGGPQSVSSALSDAMTYSSNLKSAAFTVKYGDLSGGVRIGLKVMKASRNNNGAFLQNKVAEMDGLWESTSDSLDLALWGNGGLSLGQISAIDTNTVTLVNPQDAYNFQVGMYCTGSATDGTNGAGSLLATQSDVTAVDRAAGTVTFTSAAAVVAANTSAYIHRYGTFATDGVSKVFPGVQAFIASTDSPSALLGMTRTYDPTRQAGCRVPAAAIAGLGVEQRLKLLGSYMSGRYGAKGFGTGFLHPEDFASLESSLSARGIRPLEDETTQFGFEAITMICGTQKVKFYADARCPKDTAFIFNLKMWLLKSMGKLIEPDTSETGLVLVPAQGSTDYEFRLLCFPAGVCRGPGNNGRVSLA